LLGGLAKRFGGRRRIAARFFLEFLRGDPGRGEIIPGVLSGTQLISIFLVLGGGIIWWLKSAQRVVPAHATR